MKQKESLWVRTPVRALMHEKGWYTKLLHSDLHQKGMPDMFATHSKYGIRLIEFKIIHNNSISFTEDQLFDFPKLIINGAHIWFLCSRNDLRLDDQSYNLSRLYDKIISKSNDSYFITGQYNLLF